MVNVFSLTQGGAGADNTDRGLGTIDREAISHQRNVIPGLCSEGPRRLRHGEGK